MKTRYAILDSSEGFTIILESGFDNFESANDYLMEHYDDTQYLDIEPYESII